MMNLLTAILLVCLLAITSRAQLNTPTVAPQPVPVEFKSDGCTFFPDGIYRECCEAHDLDYYYGGTWRERWRSDKRLYDCVKSKGNFKHSVLAIMMWTAVRGLGSPIFPFKFRWGFGKNKLKKEEKHSTNNQSPKK